MKARRNRQLIAFVVSAMFWAVGLGLAVGLPTERVAPIAIVTVLLVEAIVIGPLGHRVYALVILWAASVLYLTWVFSGIGPPYGGLVPIMASLVYGTLAFVALVAIVGAMWTFYQQGRTQKPI